MLDREVPDEPQTIEDRVSSLLSEMEQRLRIKRPGTPAEAGSLFAFLASDQASFITGQSIMLDGGATL
jgi:NAD(P)-dependent dehydrogenase (short-subunit alcohol dehydrogenase family)